MKERERESEWRMKTEGGKIAELKREREGRRKRERGSEKESGE